MASHRQCFYCKQSFQSAALHSHLKQCPQRIPQRQSDASKWVQVRDPNSNKDYWYHVDTLQTTWTMPKELMNEHQPQQQPLSVEDDDKEEDDEEYEEWNDEEYVERKLNLVVVDYETEYMQTVHVKENKYISRGFSAQKQSFIDKCIEKRIKMINDPIGKVLDEYVFDVMNNKQLNGYRKEIIRYCNDQKLNGNTICNMKRADFIKDVLHNCEMQNVQLEKPLNDLYKIMGQYPEYLILSQKLNDNQQNSCQPCNCIYGNIGSSIQIIDRAVLPNKIILTCSNNKTQNNNMTMQIKLNSLEDEDDDYIVPKLEDMMVVYDDRIEFKSLNNLETKNNDILSKLNGQRLDGLDTTDVVRLLEIHPLPFDVSFKRNRCLFCCKCFCKCFYKKKKNKTKKTKSSLKTIILNWLIRFIKLSLAIITKTSSLLDTITDIYLLYKAQKAETILFTMILFITILSPYILSYSSGVQIFIYRKTFENVQLLTFKSLLLGLYLFPTGILYFILIDIIDALIELYKWFAFGCLNKIKSEQDLAKIESNVSNYFGMSRMDWISFKKQKLMAQLFFETIPQVTLQILLFTRMIKGISVTTITDRDLIFSISTAIFNSLVQLFRLKLESKAAQETFVQYALNCISCRFGWVPFAHKLQRFEDINEKKHASLLIDYKIQYRLPLVTYLSQHIMQRNATEPLTIINGTNHSNNNINQLEDYQQLSDVDNDNETEYQKILQYETQKKKVKAAFGSIQYDFSPITIQKLITVIKGLSAVKLLSKEISIKFNESLRLLGVRSIISLMQACYYKDIQLPDIHKIDWHKPFNNMVDEGVYKDPRLFEYTFDENRKSLLISLYLTGYAKQENYYLLKSFVRDYDVPINMQDNKGNTILHHIIRRKDFDAIYELMNVLKSDQHFIFDIRNHNGDTIVHEMVKQNNHSELQHLLNTIQLQANAEINLKSFNNAGESVLYLALQRDREKIKKMPPLQLIDEDNKDEKQEMKEEQLSAELFIDENDENIKQETLINVLYFMVYRIEKDPKRYGNIITMDDDKYVQMKQKLTNIMNNEESEVKPASFEKVNIELLHQLLLENDPQILTELHGIIKQSALGHVLHPQYITDIGLYCHNIINFLLDKNAHLLPTETFWLHTLFVHEIKTIPDEKIFFSLLHNVIEKCNVSIQSICDQTKNNPLHTMIKKKPFKLSIISYFCKKYPYWMIMENNNGDIPLFLAVSQKNIDVFYCLCRYMTQNKMDIKAYLRERKFVEKMINFGSELLEKESINIMKLLLNTFDYPEIFRYSKYQDKFNSCLHGTDDISLIKYISGLDQQYMDSIWKILTTQCAMSENWKNEFVLNDEKSDVSKPEQKDEEEKNEHDKEDTYDDTNEYKQDDLEQQVIDDKEIVIKEEESIDFIELAYATTVETFSALDLITDVVILKQLYESGNQWWCSWMCFLLISPYLVSHGAIVVILQKKLSFNNDNKSCCSSIFISFVESLLMTPMALLYLCLIDIIFMIFSLITTIWFFFVIIIVKISCKNLQKASQYDIREWIDKKVFEEWLNMNRTEIMGYRRLRTLSQLFFETMPQILLQLRILWVIEWAGNNNVFQIELNTLFVSIGLAICHLLLEGGIIFLDKSAFKLNFMQYSLECLGGRAQFIPFQHLIANIIRNQLFIYDRGYVKDFDKNNFDALGYKININKQPFVENDEWKLLLTLDYEEIKAKIKCVNYCATYQFSPQTMEALTQMIINLNGIEVPNNFKLNKNKPIEILLKKCMIRAEIKLGPNSFGNVDMITFCNLYQTLLNKAKFDLNSINDELVKQLKGNVTTDIDDANRAIQRTLINSGEINTIPWIYDQITPQQEIKIKLDILGSCLALGAPDLIRLDILQNCYKHKVYLGSSCNTMKQIQPIIEECQQECSQDESWYFVIIFILLYSKGTIFGERCNNRCCKLNQSLKDKLLKDFVPSFVEINKLKIPFELFESCQVFEELYRNHVEEILINKCKNYMITANKLGNKQPVEIETTFDLIEEMREWNIFENNKNKSEMKNKIEVLLYQLHKKEFVNEINEKPFENYNILFLDKLVCESKMNIDLNNYLHHTESYRKLHNRTFSIRASVVDYIGIDKLIPEFNDTDKKYIIKRLVLTPQTDEENEQKSRALNVIKSVSFSYKLLCDKNKTIIPSIYNYKFNEYDEKEMDLIGQDPCLDPNIIYLWNSELQPSGFNVEITDTNVGLSNYNYHLLHNKDNYPNLTIKCDPESDCNIQIVVEFISIADEAEVEEKLKQEKEKHENKNEIEIEIKNDDSNGKTCRFCDVELMGDNTAPKDATLKSGLDNVCSSVECLEKRRWSCDLKHEKCGHNCIGLMGHECIKCLDPKCVPQSSDFSYEDYCNICWVDPLKAAPCVKLTCEHYFHFMCLWQKIDRKWPAARLTFGFLQCPLCKKPVHHPALDDITKKYYDLRDEVQKDAVERLKIEGLANDKRIQDESSPYYNNIQKFAMDRMAFYPCSKCKKPYFGGTKACEEAGLEQAENYKQEHLVCGSCASGPNSTKKSCKKHGKKYITYKCKFCCSYATWFCWGSTHFCDSCHKKQERGDYLNRKPLSELPKCPGKDECFFGIEHPANGTADFSLGCVACLKR